MKSKWKVAKNYVGDGYLYAAYRIIDIAKTDHSGNREYGSDWALDKAEAQAAVDALNKAEVQE